MQRITQSSSAWGKDPSRLKENDTQKNNTGPQDTQAVTEGEQPKQIGPEQTMHTMKQKKSIEEIVLRTVLVVLKNGNREMVVNAFLDDGSTKTYVNADVATELSLEGTVEQYQVRLLNGNCENSETIPTQMELKSLESKTKAKINAFTANRVTGNMTATDWRPIESK